MRREEFLQQLREALRGQVSQAVINDNLTYYENYILQEIRKGKNEESVIEQLGNPRLLARTIIDTSQGNKTEGRQDADRRTGGAESSGRNYSYDNRNQAGNGRCYDDDGYYRGSGNGRWYDGDGHPRGRENGRWRDDDGDYRRNERGYNRVISGRKAKFILIVILLVVILVLIGIGYIIGGLISLLAPIIIPLILVLLVFRLMRRRD